MSHRTTLELGAGWEESEACLFCLFLALGDHASWPLPPLSFLFLWSPQALRVFMAPRQQTGRRKHMGSALAEGLSPISPSSSSKLRDPFVHGLHPGELQSLRQGHTGASTPLLQVLLKMISSLATQHPRKVCSAPFFEIVLLA